MDKSALDAVIAPVLPLPGDSEKVDGAAAPVYAYEDAIMERSSSYVSLSRQRSEDNTDDNDNNINNTSTADDGANDTKPECKFPMPDAPPMLMCALFDHLHSYPIMHIVQRLLMPSPLRRQNADCQTKGSKGGESSSGEIVHSNMNSVHVMNAGADSASSQGEDDDDDDGCEVDDQIEDPMNQIFQCGWITRRTDQALELLLRRLAGDTSSFLIGYGYPVGYDPMRFTNNGKLQQHHQHHSLPPEDEEEVSLVEAREAALLCSQHASEILTTIIQCSSLDAPVMKSLSSNPSLQRIVDLIVLPPPSSESTSKNSDVDFVAHESIMTCAITVLESLVLQLGGYGAVVASPGATGNETRESRPSNGKTNQENESLSPSEVGSTTSSKLPPNILPSLERAPTTTLRLHMTTLLTRLSELLNDPITDTWVRPSQYSGGQQRLLLGASRLHVVRLIESLVLLGDLDVDMALQTSDCLEKCIDLFWKFEWCSMLHQSAANLLVHVFEGGDCRSGLQEYLLGRCKLMQRLMDSFEFDSPDVDGTTEEGTLDPLTEKEKPRYGEMMRAIKTMFVAKCTSSMESERGSQSDDSAIEEDDGGMIAPVSEDDVDSAMEKECQDGNGDLSFTPLPQGKVASQQLQCRKGYMGHVIIVCQALVQACSHVAAEHVDKETSAISLQEQSGTSETNVDESFLTLTNPPTSNAEIVSNNVTQSPRSNEPESSTIRKVSFIDELLRKHPLFDKWQSFVSSVLVSELSVQSTPLGGQPAPTSMSHMLPPVIQGDTESSLFEIDVDISSQSVGEFIVGEIDMDENDLDTAAAMIEALRVSSKRRRASGDETAVSIANFGSTIHQPGGFRNYVYDYDDPLGRLHPFESHDCNGGEDDHGYSESCKYSDDEGFMSDAMVISKDGIVANQARKINGSINKSGSDSSDEEDDDDDNNDVPVLDLFTGSFEPDFANFDAFEAAVANGDIPFDSNEHAIDSNTSQEAFFDSINGCINHPTTDNLFDFSDTPFDLVDTLSTDAESESIFESRAPETLTNVELVVLTSP